MELDRRSLFAAGAGLGLAGAGAVSAGAGPRSIPSLGSTTLPLEIGTERPQTEAIQKALDRSAEDGAPVILPPGRFVTGALTLRGSATLVGAHGATHLIARDAEPLISGTSLAAVRLEGLTLDGQGFAEYLIRLESCGGLLTDCTILGAREAGIFALDSVELVISYNRISDCLNNGVQVWRSVPGRDGTQVVSNRVEEVRAVNGGSGENGNGINIFRAGDVQVSGNTIRACAYSAVRGNAASNLQVIANTCRDLGEVAIYSEFGFEGAVIAQNIVDGAATGIAVTNFNEGGRLASVQGNLVRNLKRRLHEPVDKRGDGITVEADTAVSGNVIENVEATGIAIGWGRYMRNVVASGNIIRNAGVGIGITSNPAAGACLVSGNMLSGCRLGAIRAFDHDKIIGGELAHEDTSTERVRISGNVAS
ncbi:MAG: TIGR03808 family TAT-translocated repetitive protein [Alphaproteobacteria bacterium]|nr:TIGR03808 family TAT-translocated repetitive protein [Alphaproteobacteria bacterium]